MRSYLERNVILLKGMSFQYMVRITVILICITVLFPCCRKFVDVGAPVTSSNTENVYTNDATAASVLTGIYIALSKEGINGSSGLTSVTAIAGLSSDELVLVNNDAGLLPYYNNSLLSSTTTIWNKVYSVIFSANSAIEGLNNSSMLTPDLKKQLLGEALFIRAFSLFYLVNLYGEVPLPLSTDYKINSLLPRVGVEVVYKQMINDLKSAQSLLNVNYVDATGMINTMERVRPNKTVATALLARVYLYFKDYINAELQSTTIIENKNLYDIVPLNEVFLKNSKEAIWQLQPVGVDANANTKEGQFFIPLSATINSVPVYLTNSFVAAFEAGDARMSNWVNTNVIGGSIYYYPFKYKIGRVAAADLEYSVVLRLGEQYLIRGEARAKQGKLDEAASDINVIRTRAGLGHASFSSQEELLAAIEHERQIELFTEYGHRWLDLKRTDRANAVLQLIKGANWQTTDQLYPIPQIDIDRNPSLRGHQNPGYN